MMKDFMFSRANMIDFFIKSSESFNIMTRVDEIPFSRYSVSVAPLLSQNKSIKVLIIENVCLISLPMLFLDHIIFYGYVGL